MCGVRTLQTLSVQWQLLMVVDVQSMAVSPEHWGKGIGKKLLKRGLEEVDKAGQDIYLEATPAAVAMYRSCGFQELERIEMCDGQLVMSPMIRRYAADPSS